MTSLFAPVGKTAPRSPSRIRWRAALSGVVALCTALLGVPVAGAAPASAARSVTAASPALAAASPALSAASPALAAASPAPSGAGILASGQELQPGQSVTSANGQFVLTMRTTGNLAETSGTATLWSTRTYSRDSTAVMQKGGNLVVFAKDGRRQWTSGTHIPGSRLIIFNTAELAVVSPKGSFRWSKSPPDDLLRPGQELKPAWSIRSTTGYFRVVMNRDGALAEYLVAGSNRLELWTTKAFAPGSVAVMQADGDVVVYSPAGSAVWSSGTSGHAGARLVVSNGADAVVASLRGAILWNDHAATVRTAFVSTAASQFGYWDDPAGTFCNRYTAFWGSGYSCTNTNRDEEWCSDFAAWVWWANRVRFTYGWGGGGEISGSAATFAQYGHLHGTFHSVFSKYKPKPGDVVLYGLNSTSTWADHVAVVVTPGKGGPNVVNGDWWSATNGGVQPGTNESTATGTDHVSGYVSPVFSKNTVKAADAAAVQSALQAARAARAPLVTTTPAAPPAQTWSPAVGLTATLHTGVYTDGPDGSAHDVLTVARAGSSPTFTGIEARLTATGAATTFFTYKGVLSVGGQVTLTASDGRVFTGTAHAGEVTVDLPTTRAAGPGLGRSFAWHGDVP